MSNAEEPEANHAMALLQGALEGKLVIPEMPAEVRVKVDEVSKKCQELEIEILNLKVWHSQDFYSGVEEKEAKERTESEKAKAGSVVPIAGKSLTWNDCIQSIITIAVGAGSRENTANIVSQICHNRLSGCGDKISACLTYEGLLDAAVAIQDEVLLYKWFLKIFKAEALHLELLGNFGRMASETFEKSIRSEFRLAFLLLNTSKEPEKAMEKVIDVLKDKMKIPLGVEKRVNSAEEDFALPARKRGKEKERVIRKIHTERQFNENVEERVPLEPEEELANKDSENSDEEENNKKRRQKVALKKPGLENLEVKQVNLVEKDDLQTVAAMAARVEELEKLLNQKNANFIHPDRQSDTEGGEKRERREKRRKRRRREIEIEENFVMVGIRSGFTRLPSKFP